MKRSNFSYQPSFLLFVSIGFVVFLSVQQVESGVIGIDLGSTWFKVGAIHGTTFDILVNGEGRRKQPVLMGFDRGERVFGRDAERLWNRDPRSIFGYTPQLLGKPLNHSFFEQQGHHFPYTLLQDPSRGGSILLPVTEAQDGKGAEYTPEEIVAMILNVARQTVKESLETDIPDVVFAIPPSYTQHERLALKSAAAISGLNVLSFIHTGTATALNYALTRTKEELAEPHHVIFYDMGASQTSVSLAYFSHVPGQSKNKAEDLIPQVQIIATAWDETLGGREFDHRLAHYLAEKATEISGQNMKDYPRAMAALLREARRVKEVLSANSASKVMIEGLLGDFDFKYDITRQTFESLCADLLARVPTPLLRVLQSSGLSIDDIANVEIFGGGTRIPAIQDAITKAFGDRPVSKRLNSDDAAALGATFFAATVSSTLKIKTQYRVKDITAFPVLVNVTSGGGLDAADRITTIVRADNRLGIKKTLSFKTVDPTPVELDLYYSEEAVPAGTPLGISHYQISNLPDPAAEKIVDDFKVVLSFRLEKTGLVALEHAEAQYTIEERVREQPLPPAAVLSTEDDQETEPQAVLEDILAEPEADPAAAAPETAEEPNEAPATGEAAEPEAVPAEAAAEAEPPADEPVYITKHSSRTKTLAIHADFLGLIPLDTAGIRAARSSITRFERAEKLIAETAEARNSLEAFIYDVRDRIDEDEQLLAHSTEVERDELRSLLSNASEWLYDAGEQASMVEYRAKLADTRPIYDKITFRIQQRSQIGEQYAKFTLEINTTLPLIASYFQDRNITEEDQSAFTSKLSSIVADLQARLESQSTLPLWEEPVILLSEIDDHSKWLQTQLRRFRARPYKLVPKVKPTRTPTNHSETGSESPSQNTTTPEHVEEPSTPPPTDTVPPSEAETNPADNIDVDAPRNEETVESEVEVDQSQEEILE